MTEQSQFLRRSDETRFLLGQFGAYRHRLGPALLPLPISVTCRPSDLPSLRETISRLGHNHVCPRRSVLELIARPVVETDLGYFLRAESLLPNVFRRIQPVRSPAQLQRDHSDSP